MSPFVIDASVLIKTVVEEDGSAQAVALLESGAAVAPDLIMPECANILWKKTRRGEYTSEEAKLAAQILQRAEFEIAPSRMLTEHAVEYSAMLDHPAYDCVYLALALARVRALRFVTADTRSVSKLKAAGSGFEDSVPLGDALSVPTGCMPEQQRGQREHRGEAGVQGHDDHDAGRRFQRRGSEQ